MYSEEEVPIPFWWQILRFLELGASFLLEKMSTLENVSKWNGHFWLPYLYTLFLLTTNLDSCHELSAPIQYRVIVA